ncbi:cytochrome ubiquinol oxidase subunit I [Aneurinibacillus tyrosinisolvens]|uniref:cytochrome ubiquinol oxidase subunit I n=1 Tax=Aneurinibacillus tyrosinisolvens TaxID=1443435 RepID=UPI00063EE698|nr:cytochrome ubiquinol oxidase subunit I [Aneurinibacillus tyrosinisolvens]
MDDVTLARTLFGTTMAFHIIFATLGVGIPFMILVVEILYQWKKDRDYNVMAKRWTKALAVLLGVAIPTGTIAAVQLSLLWPGFMEIVGKVIALPFQIEIFAFLLEALFMSLYVYAADRLSPVMRIVSVGLVALGALASGVLITNVHAFQETPTGFRLEGGQVTDVNPWAGFFNPMFFVTSFHMGTSAYITGAFAITAIAAYKMLRTKNSVKEFVFHRKALMVGLAIGGIFALLTGLNGHESAQALHRYQPEKLAAAEGLFETRAYAPLAVGGFTDPVTHELRYAIEIPWLLSFLAGNRFNEVVVGLNEFPEEYWPPLYIHTLFNGMVGVGMFLIFLSVFGFAWRHGLKRDTFPRWLMWIFVASGPMAVLGIEFGWIFACTGRQPWILYRIMLTAEAATKSGNLGLLFVLFVGVYLLLGVATIVVLRHYFRRHPLAKELGEQPLSS